MTSKHNTRKYIETEGEGSLVLKEDLYRESLFLGFVIILIAFFL